MQGGFGAVLPLVEQIDPTLVPEIFLRVIATRPPIGNPRSLHDESPSRLVMLLGWYDREVAAALFEPVRALMEQTDEGELAKSTDGFLSWSIFDPRAAVARLEQMRATTGPETSAIFAIRGTVGEMLGLSFEDRWRRVWSGHSGLRFLLERDVW